MSSMLSKMLFIFIFLILLDLFKKKIFKNNKNYPKTIVQIIMHMITMISVIIFTTIIIVIVMTKFYAQ